MHFSSEANFRLNVAMMTVKVTVKEVSCALAFVDVKILASHTFKY